MCPCFMSTHMYISIVQTKKIMPIVSIIVYKLIQYIIATILVNKNMLKYLFLLSLNYHTILCQFQVYSTVIQYHSVQFSLVAKSCPTLCDPMNCSTPGLPVHHQLPEFNQTHVHQVGDAIQPSHPLSSPSPAPSPSQHQSLFQ